MGKISAMKSDAAAQQSSEAGCSRAANQLQVCARDPLRGRASASCSISLAISSEGLRYRALHSTRFQRAVDKWRLTAAWFRASLLKMINTTLITFPPDVLDVLVYVPGFNCISSSHFVSFQIFLFHYRVPENSVFIPGLKASGYIWYFLGPSAWSST